MFGESLQSRRTTSAPAHPRDGKAWGSTRTVVTSSILILVLDYFLTQILLSVLVAP